MLLAGTLTAGAVAGSSATPTPLGSATASTVPISATALSGRAGHTAGSRTIALTGTGLGAVRRVLLGGSAVKR